MPEDDKHATATKLGTGSPSYAPSLTDAEVNRQIGQGKVPDAYDKTGAVGWPVPENHAGEPNVGAARAPTSAAEIEERDGKTLTERLADKDVSPIAQGGRMGKP